MAGLVRLVLPGANPWFHQWAEWMLVSTGSSMKPYARLGEQCGSVAEVYFAMSGKVGSERCVDPLIAKALPTIDLMNSCIRVGSMMNPSLYPTSVEVGKGCLDPLMMNLHPPLDSAVGHALMILTLLDYGGAKPFLLLVSIAAIASLGPVPLEELVLFLVSMLGVESLV